MSEERKAVEAFFSAMIDEFSGSDDGHGVTLDWYTVENGLQPFLDNYIKRFDLEVKP